MNVIIPIAGDGTRLKGFRGQTLPKPLVKVNGKSLFEWAISSLDIVGTYYFIARVDWDETYKDEVMDIAKRVLPNECEAHLITTDKTSGAAQTCLMPFELKMIDEEDELIITNCDQFTNWNSQEFIDFKNEHDELDAIVSVFEHEPDIEVGKRYPYSFVKLDENGYATEFAEKIAISEVSLNGVHYWRKGSDFNWAAKQPIDNSKTEFYLSKTLNPLIRCGKKIGTYHMTDGEFYALGSEDEILKNEQFLPQ